MADSAGMRRPRRRIPLLLVVAAVLCFSTLAPQLIYGATDPTDTAALRGLMNDLKGTPSSWGRSGDPCSSWEGIVCSDSRVTIIKLSSMGLQGTLSSDIAQLSELQILDLSFNPNLRGPLTRNIENLKKLTTLILMSCSFGGPIPPELGNLSELTFIALNSNNFTGTIPGSLGKLSKVYWLDLADNQLTGSLPLSSGTSTPGLNMLTHTKHFHFNKNQLSGTIPPDFFSPGMSLIHVLFDSNKFTGSIPDSIGLVTTLEVLRLDRNQLSGGVPSTIGNLSKVTELNLANNKLTGVLPDLSGMSSLNYVDLSNNTFSPSGAPKWFSDLPLTTLVIESAGLTGQIPASVFGNFQLQQVLLRRNHINGTLDIRGTISPQLQRVDMRDNEIMYITEGIGKQITIILIGNPICKNQVTGNYCLLRDEASTPYSTSLVICQGTTCYQGQSLNPSVCKCAYPYEGIMIFRAPSFSDLSNASRFQNLEQSLWTKLGLQPGSVFIANPFFNFDNYIELQVKLFPTDTLYFNRTEIQRLGFMFSNQTYKPPKEFGPYVFQALEYPFIDKSNQKKTVNTAVIAGIAVACFVLVMILIVVGLYAFKQKKKADRAAELSRPFASWAPSGRETGGGAPQLKGARWFSFDDVKKSTNNFSDGNEIGSGGYGKVYRGTLPTGQLVAIKRATQGSIQGGVEFKTEVELLSRVHHKNLVALVGFCFEQGEQMLVYEYIPNGTLRENLVGKTGIILDWKKRLRIALGSARGLAYLHELADPPIIHRDVKSSNILLDESLNAKVADFGLSKLISDCEKGHVSTQVKGTMGYLDPEYYMTQQLTDKSDVYSLGVVLLELLTAKLPIEKGKYIVREIKSALRTDDEERFGLSEFMDPVLRDSPTLMGLGHFIDVALKCVDDSAPNRPTMSDVVKELEVILQHDGSNPSSASSSATRFGLGKGPRHHPYNESLPKTESYEYGSGAFDSSSGFVIPATLQPK